MACYYPKSGWRWVVRPKDGVYGLKEPCIRPCGGCIGCRLDKAQQWSIRMMHEMQCHDEGCFITLTYNNENLPEDRSLSKDELQKFFKLLRMHLVRKHKGKEVRYYACGEYGSNGTIRPHYHAILFGHEFQDKELLRHGGPKRCKNPFKQGPDHSLYTSKTLEKIWSKGFVTIGDVSLESCGYVARYCLKKIYGEPALDHYQGRTPEFALMSRRPGIGQPWFDKFRSDVYPKDFVTVKGRKCRPPRYYDYLLEKNNSQLLEDLKEKRREHGKIEETVPFQKSEEFSRKNRCKILSSKRLHRSYEK